MQNRKSDSLPLVSILINNYNYGRFLAEAINSALSQTYPNKEVVVVDDGSTDNSREVIARYGDAIVPVLKANGGQASAFNAGFAASRGDILCFLDADDLFLPEKVAAIADILKNGKESCWCFHPLKLFYEEKTSEVTTTLDASHDSNLVEDWDLRDEMKRGGIRNKKFLIPPTSGLCFTRSLLQKILPMPEAKGISIGDSYLQFVAVTLAKGVTVEKKLSIQRIHDDNNFSCKTNKQKIIATIHCLTAYWMREKFPYSFQFTNNLFASGLSAYWHVNKKEEKTREIIHTYLKSTSFFQVFKIYIRAAYYHFMKNH